MNIETSTQHLQIKDCLYSENWKFFQVSLRVNSFIVTALCATPECPWRAKEMGKWEGISFWRQLLCIKSTSYEIFKMFQNRTSVFLEKRTEGKSCITSSQYGRGASQVKEGG